MTKLIKFLFWSSIAVTTFGILTTLTIYLYLKPDLPEISLVDQSQLQIPLKIYTSDGVLIGEFGEKKRRPINFDDIPKNLKNAFLAAEDDGFKQEVLSMIFPDENEEWLNFEGKRLTEFTRIFPPPPPPPDVTEIEKKVKEDANSTSVIAASENVSSSSSAAIGESGTINGSYDQEDGEDEDEEVDEEAEADDNNYNVDIIVASEVNIKAKNENIPKKHKAAPYEDLVLHAFVNDRRQTLRMRAPLANRQRPSSEENQGSLPPLHTETSRGFVHGTVAHNLLSRGGPGWRAPPRIEKKKIDRVPTQNQSEAAQRLSQGLSSSHNKNTTKRSMNKSRFATSRLPAGVLLDQGSESSMMGMGIGPVEYTLAATQQAMDTAQYNPNQIQNASLIHGQQTLAQQQQQMLQYGRSGNPGMDDLPPRIRRLMEESRQARVRFEASRVQVPASVLRQQQFRFDESPAYVSGAQSFSLTAATNQTGGVAAPPTNGQQGIPSVPYPIPVIPQSQSIGPKAFTLPEPTVDTAKGSVTGNGSIQRAAIQGRRSPSMMQQTVQSNIHQDGGGGISEQSLSSAYTKAPAAAGVNVMNAPLHPGDIALAKRRLQTQNASSGNNNVSGSEATGDANDEKMLQHLFPGWF